MARAPKAAPKAEPKTPTKAAPKAEPKTEIPAEVVVSKNITLVVQNGNATQFVKSYEGETVTARHLIVELIKHEAVA